MASEAALFSTFTITRGSSDALDQVFGTITGPILFSSCEQIEDSAEGDTKYQVALTYIAGTDAALEYTIKRFTFTKGAAVEVDTAYATIAGVQKASFLKKVSEDSLTVTYDLIVLHLNA